MDFTALTRKEWKKRAREIMVVYMLNNCLCHTSAQLAVSLPISVVLVT